MKTHDKDALGDAISFDIRGTWASGDADPREDASVGWSDIQCRIIYSHGMLEDHDRTLQKTLVQRQTFIGRISFRKLQMKMRNHAVQGTIDRKACSKCMNVAIGTRVKGGFLCEECIRILTIQEQLWTYPAEFRNQIIVDEGLSL